MIKIFTFKNWEIFLVLFLIPSLIHINLPFLFTGWTYSFVLTAIFMLAWIALITIWFYLIGKKFSTNYIGKNEIKLYNFNLLAVYIVLLVFTVLVLLLFYGEIPALENSFTFLSKLSIGLKIYIYTALIVILLIASRIVSAYMLNQNLELKDYYKNAIAFLLFPVGIFWIQPQLRQKTKDKLTISEKNRNIILIGITIFLVFATYLNLKDKEFEISFGNKSNQNLINDSSLTEYTQHQSDSIFDSMDDSSKAEYIFNSALKLYQFGQFRNAINNLTFSIQLNSTNPEYYYNRGVILYEAFNQLDSAILDMSMTIELDTTNWKAFHNRGFYNYLLENYEIAIPDISKSIELNTSFSDSYLLRGELKNLTNDKIGACEDWAKADSLGNGDAMLKIMSECN